MFEERVQVGIRAPEVLAFPADAMRAIAGGIEALLDDPGFWIQAEDHPGGRNRHPQLAVLTIPARV